MSRQTYEEFVKQGNALHQQLTRYRKAAKEQAAEVGVDISVELSQLRRAFNEIESIIDEASP